LRFFASLREKTYLKAKPDLHLHSSIASVGAWATEATSTRDRLAELR
jgi:hypothetical protein